MARLTHLPTDLDGGERVRGFAFFIAGLLTIWGASGCSAPEDARDEAPIEGPTAAAPTETGGASDEAGEGAVLASTDEFQVGLGDLGDREALPGAALYADNCAACHDGSVPKAPLFTWLEMMSARTLLGAMNDGIMAAQAADLTADERVHIVEYLTRQRYVAGAVDDLADAHCEAPRAAFDRDRPAPRVGWGHDTRRFVPGDVAGLSAADVPDLELAWAFVFPDALRARSQPAIGYGAVFVGSQDGRVYALDLETGCVRWHYQAAAEVRTGIVVAEIHGRPMAFFGDILAWVHAVDALTGEPVWKRKADEHPGATLSGTPALHEGVLYVPVSSLEIIAAADPAYECCTFRGSVLAVNAANGSERWRSYSIPEPPTVAQKTSAGTNVYAPSGAPIWASPAIDAKRNRLYVGTGENYSTPADGNSDAVLAIDLTTGERIWTRQMTEGDAWNVACMMADNPNCPPEDGPDFDLGSSQMIVDLADGRQVLVGGHKIGAAFAFDLDAVKGDDPEPLWWTRVGRGSIQGGVHFGMAADGTTIYVPINDMNDTRNGDVLDPEAARPGVHAVNAADGKVLWSRVQPDRCGDDRPFCDPGISAATTAVPGVLFAGHLDGVIRAYERESGNVLWSFDSAREFTGVDGRVGRGGGMSGAGPAVGEGYVVVNSGYGLYFHEPGNVLLAFRPSR